MKERAGKHLTTLVAAALLAATILLYLQAAGNGFVGFDDEHYLTANPQVRSGLTWEGFLWAWRSSEVANWHPLTWLSHMVDVQLFGMNPGPHHLMSVLFHGLSTVLLFLLLRSMTGALWRSALVAALFAFHPLHTESVAWASERKDVLSGLLWILTMGAYLRYVREPSIRRYSLALALFALGLTAKPMLVTLPFALLLMDYWPLGRVAQQSAGGGGPDPGARRKNSPSGIVLEKLPFLALTAASIAVTYTVQSRTGAVGSTQIITLPLRAANALVSYVEYMGKMLWPVGLSVFYPYRLEGFAAWQVALSALMLLFLSLLALRWARRRPYFAAGWFWYVGTLVPVIGLVQAGSQSMADRYTYLPLVGLFILAAWGLEELAAGRPSLRGAAAGSACAALAALAALTSIQVRYWRDDSTLFGHALEVDRKNWLAHKMMGNWFYSRDRMTDAETHYREALLHNPTLAEAYNNLGTILLNSGRIEEAVQLYRRALVARPRYAEAYYNLGIAHAFRNETAAAIGFLNDAVRIDPAHLSAHYNLGVLLSREGRTGEAFEHYLEVARLDPGDFESRLALGDISLLQGRPEGALRYYREALRIRPDSPAARQGVRRASEGTSRKPLRVPPAP